MSKQTAGYGFIIEFSEAFATRVAKNIFTENGISTHFSDKDTSPPGPIKSRAFPSGKEVYKKYLADAALGYDITVTDPEIKFIIGTQEAIELKIGFGFLFSRELYLRQFTSVLEIPDDPSLVDPSVDYTIVHETVPGPDFYPPPGTDAVEGVLKIVLPLVVFPFSGSKGHRVTIDATQANMGAVVLLKFTNVTWNAPFTQFVEITSSKILTELLRNEIKEIDITPMLGALDAFDLRLKPPIDLRLSKIGTQRLLGIGFNVHTQVKLGDKTKMPFTSADTDFAAQFDEGFFSQLIQRVYDDRIPHRYNRNGDPDAAGGILLLPPALKFNSGELELNLMVRTAIGDLFCNASIKIISTGVKTFDVEIAKLSIHLSLKPIPLSRIVKTVTFYLLDGFIAQVIGDILTGPVENGLNSGLNDFINSGSLAFAFNSPIRKTRSMVSIEPVYFGFEPGRAIIQANMNIN